MHYLLERESPFYVLGQPQPGYSDANEDTRQMDGADAGEVLPSGFPRKLVRITSPAGRHGYFLLKAWE